MFEAHPFCRDTQSRNLFRLKEETFKQEVHSIRKNMEGLEIDENRKNRIKITGWLWPICLSRKTLFNLYL
jgi:hypothetical protein